MTDKKSKTKSKEERAAKWAKKKSGEVEKKPEKTAKKAKPDKKAALAKTEKAEVEIMLSRSEAEKLNSGMKDDLRSAERSVVEFAKKLDKFVKGEGWKALGYAGMTEWRNTEMGFSEFYNARNVAKLLAAGVSPERIDKIPLTNINVMARQLPPSKWTDEKILEAAETQPVAAFETQAKKRSNEIGMAVEEELSRGFKASKSVVENWDTALRIANLLDGAKGIEQQIERIVATYLNSAYGDDGGSRLQRYQETYEEKKAS